MARDLTDRLTREGTIPPPRLETAEVRQLQCKLQTIVDSIDAMHETYTGHVRKSDVVEIIAQITGLKPSQDE